jgi:transcriptional regulator with XRE-family HTH domain
MKDLKTLLAEKFQDKDFEQQFHGINAFFRLADELLILRKKRKMTQQDLAEKAGTTQAVISRLENASVMPSMETIIKIADALGAAVDVRLMPLEEIRTKETEAVLPDSQKEQDVVDGIVYYHQEPALESKLNWIDVNAFSSMSGISGKPALRPLGKTKKIRDFA